MHGQSFVAIVSVLLLGCGGGAPIYKFRPTGSPLRYMVSDPGDLLIETAMCEQYSTDSSRTYQPQTAEGSDL